MIASSHTRISLSLVALMVFIILLADWLGFMPNEQTVLAQSRVVISEAMAVQLSASIQNNNVESIPAIFEAIVERNPDIRSVVFKQLDGRVVSGHGDHPKKLSKESTLNFMIVPIYRDNKEWGVAEIAYNPPLKNGWWQLFNTKFYQLIIFVIVIGFVLYFFFINKLLKRIDPGKVIPERVKKAFNALTEGVVLIDDSEKIVLLNRSFEKKSGKSMQQLLGSKLSNLSWFYPERYTDNEDIYPWIKSIKNRDSSSNITLNFKSSDKEVITYIVNSTPLIDENNIVRGALVSFSDVTELEQMNKDLESMTQFMRHEMRNALVSATMTIARLEESKHLSQSDMELLRRAEKSHRFISYLLDSVQQAKSIETSFSKEKPYPLRLDKLIAETVNMYSEMYSGNEFSFESDEKSIMVLGQSERIVQMLDKLVTNAIDHGAQNTPIIISCRNVNNNAVISVTNNGEVLPENKEAMFDLFSSFSHDAVSHHNQGIGLYVVKLIAEAYEGRAYARDREDGLGAEFIINLPAIG